MPTTKITYAQTRQIQQFHPETVTFEWTVSPDDDVSQVYAFLKAEATRLLYGAPPGETVSAPPIKPLERAMTAKQFAYMESLVNELGWSSDRLEAFIREQGFAPELTATQASKIIDELKQLVNGRYPEPNARTDLAL